MESNILPVTFLHPQCCVTRLTGETQHTSNPSREGAHTVQKLPKYNLVKPA